MPIEKTITLYTFDELSDKAKDKARDWWQQCRGPEDFDFVRDDFVEVASRLGIVVSTSMHRTYGGNERPFPNVYWSLGYSQSDGAAFDGNYSYRKGAAKAVRAYAPQDTVLHGIADRLQEAQAKSRYQATAAIREQRGCISTEVQGAPYEREAYDRWCENVERPIQDAMRALCQWLYNQLRAEDEYQSSDEQIADAMAVNEYTFREDGTRED